MTTLNNEVLQLGSTGDLVKILQEKLKILGFYNGIVTGSFDLSTEIGLRAFQSSVGLQETRAVNEVTWQKILEYTTNPIATISNYPTIKYGSSGEVVEDLQSKLKSLLYYSGEISGNFDLETENAVKRFQANNKLTADGIVGKNTWTSLNSLYGNLKECAIQNDENKPTSSSTYIVKRGDTLYSIAKLFNTTVVDLKKLNNLTSNTIQIGQVLKIPTNEDEDIEYQNYQVKAGDTLYQIAKNYKTTVNELKKINNLSSDILSIGQILKVPVTDEESYIDYVVEKGNTLYSIAQKYNTTVNELKKINNLSSDILSIDQVLKIPT